MTPQKPKIDIGIWIMQALVVFSGAVIIWGCFWHWLTKYLEAKRKERRERDK
jgi:hypothetical protein